MEPIDVIYIEDDETEALIMQINMRRLGINILHIPFISADRLHELQAPPYDTAAALFFDEMLAGESGADLAMQLRGWGDRRLIFLLTAGDNPNPAEMTTKSILFRRKPVDFEELADTIRKLQNF